MGGKDLSFIPLTFMRCAQCIWHRSVLGRQRGERRPWPRGARILGGKMFTEQIRKYLPSYRCDMCSNEEPVKEGSVLLGEREGGRLEIPGRGRGREGKEGPWEREGGEISGRKREARLRVRALEFRILVPAAVCPWPSGKPLCGTLSPSEKRVGGGEVLVGARVPQGQAKPTWKSGNSIWMQPCMKEGDRLGGTSDPDLLSYAGY